MLMKRFCRIGILENQKSVNYYDRIASTGSIRAAIAAGTIPEIKPIDVDTPSPSTIFLIESVTSKLPIGI